MPKVGDMAPDFSLKYFDGTDRKDIKLSDYRGKKNVVAGVLRLRIYRWLNPANEKLPAAFERAGS